MKSSISLLQKPSSWNQFETPIIKFTLVENSVFICLSKAEEALASGIEIGRFQFEDDLGTGLHDVDFGIRNTEGITYETAYQFKSLEGKLTNNKIKGASKQLIDVQATNKIVEIDCPYTVRSKLSEPQIVKEMKYQNSNNGITEFRFILESGEIVIINPANL